MGRFWLKIEFGTDGWRGVVGEDYNFKNIKKIAKAILNYLNKKPDIFPFHKEKIIIGYDTRFLGKETALILSQLFSNSGYDVLLSISPISTPALSFAVVHFNLPIGIMITASHNPAIYNGIKIKAWYGGSALPEIYEGIKSCLNEKKISKKERGKVEEVDIKSYYLNYLKENVDWEIIKKFNGKIIWDAMFGGTSEIIKNLFKEMSIKGVLLNSYPDPYFGGIQPEPIPKNIKKTIDYVKKYKIDLTGIADGDGDRIGILTNDGSFLWNHTIFSLLSIYLIEEKNEKKGIAKTFSSSLYLNRIAKKYNVPLIETPIGFKYLCPYLLRKEVSIAGEESGGIAFSNSLPERDAILSFLKIIEMIAFKRKSLLYFLKRLYAEFGKLNYEREDLNMEIERANAFVEKIYKNPPKEICDFKISKVKKLDGVKLYFNDKGWLLFRASGTENLLRIYCEMESQDEINEIFHFIKKYMIFKC